MGAASYWLLAAGQTALRWSGLHVLNRRRACLQPAAFAESRRSRRLRSGDNHVLEQRILPAGDEAQLQPAKDVVHDAFGDRDLRVAGEARGLKARVAELVAQELEGHAVLQGQRDRGGERVHEAG